MKLLEQIEERHDLKAEDYVDYEALLEDLNDAANRYLARIRSLEDGPDLVERMLAVLVQYLTAHTEDRELFTKAYELITEAGDFLYGKR